MSMIWRCTMPLLTTLAAMVIIAHCVEEDMQKEYRHELRPRFLDTGTSNYDQAWRAIEEEPDVQNPRQVENWGNSSPDGAPKRRRLGRKRKRRPQTNPSEEIALVERPAYPDEPPRPYYDVDNARQTTEMPKRRRRKPDSRPFRLIDDGVMVEERPLRKNGGRRKKRPSLDTQPELSEFRPIANLNDEEVDREPETNPHEKIAQKVFGHHRDIIEHIPGVNEDPISITFAEDVNAKQNAKDDNNDDNEERVPDVDDEPMSITIAEVVNAKEDSKDPITDDKSLSEFSMELVSKPEVSKNHESEVYESRINIPEMTDIDIHDLEEEKPKKNEKSRRLKNVKKISKSHTEDNEQPTSTVKVDVNFMKFLNRNATDTDITEQLKSELKANFIEDTANKLRLAHEWKINLGSAKSIAKVLNNSLKQTAATSESPLDLWTEELLADAYQSEELSLKEILKRSNGSSLSEILQQHNLSLSDLLHGKEHAISLLKQKSALAKNVTKDTIKDDSIEHILMNAETKYAEDLENKHSTEDNTKNVSELETKQETDSVTKLATQPDSTYATEPVTEYATELVTKDDKPTETVLTDLETETQRETTTPNTLKDTDPKIATGHRYLIGLRKKLRMRPVLNTTNTHKGQLSRDLVVQNSRKYSNFRRNRTKSNHWKDVISSMLQNSTNNEGNNRTVIKTTIEPTLEETTISIDLKNNKDFKLDDIDMDVTESTVAESLSKTTTAITKNTSEKPVSVVTMARPTAISSGLRRQALNNRLKRKRNKTKISSTEIPQDDIIKHLYGMNNLVSSSEFIARTQEPKTTEEDSTEFTTLNDLMMTTTRRTNGHVRIKTQTKKPKFIETTTEDAAKLEIEEIFNDTETRRKLSRILKERNMTLNELAELRERGSSHLHLADVFHNASREPNPAEPFLSKSLLEPISKETYPLRAILEANLHDPKVASIDSDTINTNKIPVVMDFRNNVNENAENMGIMSLFNNYTKISFETTTSVDEEDKNITESETETNYTDTHHETTVTETTSNVIDRNHTVRESRVLEEIKDDIVSWNDIFTMMGRNHNDRIEGTSITAPNKKITIEEDADGDGLIVLEDLQRLAELETSLASAAKEKLDLKSDSVKKGTIIPAKRPSHTKSVTIATACIAGLAMVLFLLTYTIFKWKQQRAMRRKPSYCDEQIPTPVFENRKGHKNNSTTRSISPIIQTSHIYTLNTLDSQNGKESPDYMWDSLRKPFQ